MPSPCSVESSFYDRPVSSNARPRPSIDDPCSTRLAPSTRCSLVEASRRLALSSCSDDCCSEASVARTIVRVPMRSSKSPPSVDICSVGVSKQSVSRSATASPRTRRRPPSCSISMRYSPWPTSVPEAIGRRNSSQDTDCSSVLDARRTLSSPRSCMSEPRNRVISWR